LKRLITILIAGFVLAQMAKAQDIHFTQFYAVPMYLNPAFAGADRCSKFSLATRNQWLGVDKGYNTYLVSYDAGVTKYSSGLGFLFASDIAGTGGLKTTKFDLNYAYEVLLARKLSLRFGLQAGIQQLKLRQYNLLFGDQVVRGMSATTLENITDGKTIVDMGTGTLLYSENYWLGLSFNHLNRPNESLLGYDSRLPVKFSLHGGIRLRMNNPIKKNQTEYVVPAFNYLRQNKFSQISWGMYYIKNPLNIGLWYRGIPFTNNTQDGYSNNDAISILIALVTPKFHFGYSYDLTLSKLTMASGGAHEVTCYYLICKKKKKSKFTKLLPCPKF